MKRRRRCRCWTLLKRRNERPSATLVFVPILRSRSRLALTPELRALLEDATVPKRVHDWKLALHILTGLGVSTRGAVEDGMLLSYALNPTHSTQALADVAARNGQNPPVELASGRGGHSRPGPGLTHRG